MGRQVTEPSVSYWSFSSFILLIAGLTFTAEVISWIYTLLATVFMQNCLCKITHRFNRHFGLSTKETALCGMSADFSHAYYIYVGVFVAVL